MFGASWYHKRTHERHHSERNHIYMATRIPSQTIHHKKDMGEELEGVEEGEKSVECVYVSYVVWGCWDPTDGSNNLQKL